MPLSYSSGSRQFWQHGQVDRPIACRLGEPPFLGDDTRDGHVRTVPSASLTSRVANSQDNDG